MQKAEVIKTDISAHQWMETITSAINDISTLTYPHFTITVEILNYVMNAYNDTDYGLICEYFDRLLEIHPPCPEKRSYYMCVLNAQNIKTSKNMEKFDSFFWHIIDLILQVDFTKTDVNTEEFQYPTTINDQVLTKEFSSLLPRKNVIYFENLPVKEQVRRLFCAFDFITRIVDLDASANISNCLLTGLIWPESYHGCVTEKVGKIMKLFLKISKYGSCHQISIIQRLVSVLAEIMWYMDGHALGPRCFQLSFSINALLKQENLSDYSLIESIKSDWLRLLLNSQILSDLCSCYCPPELATVAAIFSYYGDESIIQPKKKRKKEGKFRTRELDYSRIKDINSFHNAGETRLQKACRLNNVERVQAFVQHPELDLNKVDIGGDTALMIAVKWENVACAHILLNHVPENPKQEPLNVNCFSTGQTPLMSAVENDNTELIALLLCHSGPTILQSTKDDKTIIDIARSEGLRNLLTNFQKGDDMDYKLIKSQIDADQESAADILHLAQKLLFNYILFHKSFNDKNLTKIQKMKRLNKKLMTLDENETCLKFFGHILSIN